MGSRWNPIGLTNLQKFNFLSLARFWRRKAPRNATRAFRVDSCDLHSQPRLSYNNSARLHYPRDNRVRLQPRLT